MRNQRGITLIALVITIIVLLILAGVSIAMLTGDNGILSNAQKAKDETLKSEVIERINIALNDVKTEIYAQQADDPSWDPLNAGNTAFSDDVIETVLENNDFAASSGTLKDATYEYTLKSGILELTYYNTTSEIGTASAPIKGTITLNTTSYTIDEAK